MSFIDKAKDKLDEVSGKGKEEVGERTGNEQLQAEGQGDQAKADFKQAGEKVKDAFN